RRSGARAPHRRPHDRRRRTRRAGRRAILGLECAARQRHPRRPPDTVGALRPHLAPQVEPGATLREARDARELDPPLSGVARVVKKKPTWLGGRSDASAYTTLFASNWSSEISR